MPDLPGAVDYQISSAFANYNLQYDNDLRKEKCMVGMKEKLLKGEWIGYPPTGYSYGGREIEKIREWLLMTRVLL
jgi:hypothetical protein